MPRGALRVRPAEPGDLAVLMALGEEMRDQLLPTEAGGRPRGAPAAQREFAEQRYVEALADPDRHLVVVVTEADEALGMALFTTGWVNPLVDVAAVHMSHAVVADRHKRRGAGKALVAAAAAFAELHGIEQLVVSVHPGSRDANRFFARLGFAPMAVRRVAPVAVVRRGLATSEHRPADHVVRRRPRRAGRSSPSGVPLGPAETDGDLA